VLCVQRVSKVYPLYRRPSDRILEIFPFIRKSFHTDFWALRDISLTVDRGEFIGIMGPNGSGKSTLLQILSGIVQPTCGRISTQGRIAALLELGAGFNPEFSGRENIYINGEIMGLSRREIEKALPLIESFAEIGKFIDRPVKEYSSGMYVRLAFSIAIHVDPEILIVDEALAVGDAIFANRCIQKFEELKRRKVTVLFVSHDLGLVKRLSDRAILLVDGQIQAEGRPADVVNRYVGLVLEREKSVAQYPAGDFAGSHRHGDGASRIVEVALLDGMKRRCMVVRSGEPVIIRVHVQFQKAVCEPVVGILIRNRLGIDVFGTNTKLEKQHLGNFSAGDELEIDFKFPCLLTQQEYTLTVATQYPEGFSQDWIDDILSFSVVDTKGSTGLLNLEPQIEWKRK